MDSPFFNFLKMDKENFQLNNLLIELTMSCNEQCPHCYIPKNVPFNGFLLKEESFKYIKQAFEIGVKEIAFSGGEPLMHKNFIEIIEFASNYDFQNIYVLSNLTLFNDSLLKEIKKISNLTFQTTLFSCYENIHDNLTGISGSFIKTTNALDILKKNGINVQVSCPILKPNSTSFRDLQKWVDEKDYPFYPNFDIVARTDYDVSNQYLTLNNEEKIELIKQLILIDKHPYWLKWKELIHEDNSLNLCENSCDAGINQLVISPDGEVHPCMLWQKDGIGNLKNSDLKTIWYSSKFLKALRKTHYTDFNIEKTNLDSLNYIKICYARNANTNNGNYLKISENDFRYASLLKEMVKEIN